MLAISDKVKAAWLSPARQLAIKVRLNENDYDSETITSLSFDSGSISGETFQIGSTYMNSVQIVFPSILEDVKEDQELTAEVGILVEGDYHFLSLGTFFVETFDRDRNSEVTTINANDKMIFMEGQYDSKLTFPAPIREVALEIANLSGVEVDEASFSTLPANQIAKPEGYTYRQAIGLIAQFEGGFASFNRQGKLEVRRLRPTTFQVEPENYLLKGLVKNENKYKIGGITVRTGESDEDVLKVGIENGSQVELENKVMTKTLLDRMWELVKETNYFPFELKWQGCPALEAGDWFYVTDLKGNRYSVPNLSFSFTFNGGLVANSKANTSSSSQATVRHRGTLKQQIQWITSLINSNEWNHNYYTDEEPPNPKEGDLWFKKNGQDKEIWQYSNVNGVLEWVLQISSAPNKELLELIEELEKVVAEAKKAGEEAKEAGEAAQEAAKEALEAGNVAKELAEQAQLESSQAVADANAAINAVSDMGAIVQAVEQASQLAIQQSANAVDEAQKAMQKANELIGSVNEVKGSVINIYKDIDSINGQLMLKVEKVDFDKVKGIVDTQTTQIQANAKEIALKANQSFVDTVNKTVISHTTELKTNAEKISGLVTKTDGHTSKIGALELKANQFSISLADVQSGLDGLEGGGRNYLVGTTVAKTFSTAMTGTGYTVHDPYTTFNKQSLAELGFKVGDDAVLVFDWSIAQNGTTAIRYGTFRPEFMRGNYTYNTAATDKSITLSSTNTKGQHIFRFKVNTGMLETNSLRIRIDKSYLNFTISNCYLKRGNMITDWTPAPEDLATVTALAELKITTESIRQTVASVQSKIDWQTKTGTVDLNTLTAHGNYWLATGTKVNHPTAAGNNWAYLKVEAVADGRLTQTYQADGSNHVYRRRRYDSTWYAWERVADGADITNVNNSIAQVEITANKIQQTVTSGLGARNAIYNSEGINSLEGWTISGGRWYYSGHPNDCYQGSGSLMYNFWDNTARAWNGLYSKRVPVYAGYPISTGAMIKRIGNKVPDDTVGITVEYFSQATGGSRMAYRSHFVDLSNKGDWQKLIIENYVAPTGATHVQLKLEIAKNAWVSFSQPQLVIGSATLPPYSADAVTGSQFTQLADRMNFRITNADGSITQIDLANKTILLAGDQVRITGRTTIDNAVIATAHIKDLNVSTAKLANLSVTEGKIANLAVTNGKIANLAVNAAKIADLAVVTAKIGDLAVTNGKIANLAINDAKIQNASISSAKIISLDADKVNANTLSAITTNTGDLNVSGWMSVTTDNKGMRGTFDYGDKYSEAFNYRWFDGTWRLSHRHLTFFAAVHEVNSNNTKGKFRYNGESYFGADYFKLRQYNTSSVLQNRIDITSDQISMGNVSDYSSRVQINSNGTGWFYDSITVGGVYIKDLKALQVYHIEAIPSADNLYFNSDRKELGDLRLGKDGSSVNGGRLVSSMTVYNRTYSGAANMFVTNSGAIGRTTSARKYKADIQPAYDVINHAKNVLNIKPSNWFDKGELADGVAKERYYGFIADEFAEAGLTEVVVYQNGEIESLAYDRITMYHNVILSDHEKEINILKKKIETMEQEIRVLQAA